MYNNSSRHPPHTRSNHFHGHKKQYLGFAGVPPSWRQQQVSAAQKGKQQAFVGSKIFLSQLPTDVSEQEVEELFIKTVGPLKESFIIYNSKGLSKGMAIITFTRPGDAAVAKEKYDGKLIDSRKPIRIEIISREVEGDGQSRTQSLFERIGAKSTLTKPSEPQLGNHMLPRQAAALSKTTTPTILPPRGIRQKKGPRRLQKRQMPLTAAQLDQDMEAYRSAAV